MLYNNITVRDYISRITNNVRIIKNLINDNQNLFISLDLKKAYIETIENEIEELKFHLTFQPNSIQTDSITEAREVSHA